MSSENTENNGFQLDLRMLVSDLWKEAVRLLWVGVLVAVVFTAALCYRSYRVWSPTYQATATFTVYVTNPLQVDVRSYNSATAEQMAKTFPYILTSGALSDVVTKRLGISAMPAVSASVHENTNIFTLSVKDTDPKLAYDVLNAVIECYPQVAEFVVGPTVMNLLDESGVPDTPVNAFSYKPSVKQGVVLGVLVWLAVSVFVVATRATIHNEDELKRLMNLSCIGTFPQVRGFEKRARRKGKKAKLTNAYPVLTRERSAFGFADAVNLLRIRVEKEMRELNGKVLLVSSAIPGEGKTTVCVNLALSLAQKGKRTLLVDCDLRNPSTAAMLGISNVVGMTEYLTGKAEANAILHAMETPGFYAVFGGKPFSNAAELLSQKKLKLFIDQMRNVFDYILLDTPPSSILSDASEVASLADCALMVIRQNYASKDQILESVQMITDSEIPLIGSVLNGAERKKQAGSYGYSGYGGYGYGSK